MSKLLYAWEFGAGFGHVGAFLPLARELRMRGHAVVWAVTQTAPAARLLADEGFTWLQAPGTPEEARPGPPLSYSDILLRFGYASTDRLLGLVVAWRELLRLAGAQTVLADHAPTAILAARTLHIPVVLFSSGFCVPPRKHPLPSMRPWQALAPGQLQALDDLALANINAVLAHFRERPLKAMAQLFDVAEDALIGFPELDHYADRGPARYWGNLPDAGVGSVPAWPAVEGKRLFAYLRAEIMHHEAVLSALRELGQATIVFFPDAPPGLAQRFAAPHMAFSASPVDLHRAAMEADAAVTYASMSTTTRFLLAGKPLLLLPGHLEQFLLGRRVEEMGAGLLVNPELPATDLSVKLRRVLDDRQFAFNARAFAQKYAAFPQNTVIANLTRRIEEVALGPGGLRPAARYQLVLMQPEGFEHVEAVREIMESLQGGFAELGIEAPMTVNEFDAGATPIVFCAQHLENGEEKRLPPDAILYNAEQLSPEYAHTNERYINLLSSFRVWDFSARNVALLKQRARAAEVVHVPVGYAEALTRIGLVAEDIDVLFYGRLSERRLAVLRQLEQKGAKIEVLNRAYGETRDRQIARAKIVLSVHFADRGEFESARIVYLLANRKAVVCEDDIDATDADLRQGVLAVRYESLADACMALLADPERRRSLAEQGFLSVTAPARRASAFLQRVLPRREQT